MTFKKGHIPWNKGRGIDKGCLNCGTHSKTPPSLKDKRRFCSWDCYKKYTRGHKPHNFKGYRQCLTCGQRIPSYRNFCSYNCYWDSLKGNKNPNWKRVTKICTVCGEKFEVRPSNPKRYCSRKCYSKQLIGKRFCVKHEFKRGEKQPKELVKKRMKACRKKPTRLERQMLAIIEKYELPFHYVGDGALIIGSRNPDFVCTNGKNIVLEVFGRYWHDPQWKHTQSHALPDNRIRYFKNFGYECVIVWEEDLNEEEKLVERLLKGLGGDFVTQRTSGDRGSRRPF